MSRHGRGGRGIGRSLFESFGLGAVTFAGAAGAIGATYKLTEFLVRLKKLFEVRSENAVFVRLADRVKVDLAECERLLALPEVKEAMRDNPAKVKYIQSSVQGVYEAIDGITKYTRKVSNAGWYLGLTTRIRWVLDEYEKLLHREMELQIASDRLLETIRYLSEFEDEELKRKRLGRRYRTDKYTHVDVDIDVNRRGTRRIIRYDIEGRPVYAEKEYRVYDRFDDSQVLLGRPRRDLKAEGFYDGQFDGPLSTRPRFWQPQSAGADYTTERKETKVYHDEKVVEHGGNIPLRVHWPSKL